MTEPRQISLDELLDLITRPEDRERVAESLRPMFERILHEAMQEGRSPALRETQQDQAIRVLASGSDINALSSGTSVFTGPSRGEVLDFLGATGYRDTYDRNIYRIRTAGGGADCMFDVLVSSCWAAEVAAGMGTEGQAFTSITGCTFYVVSTIQYAWDGVNAMTGAKNYTTACTVFICPGGGIGQLSISGDNGNTNGRVIFQGTNNWDSIIPGTGLTHSVTITGGSKDLTFRDIFFGGGTLQSPFKKTNGSQFILLERCRVGSGVSEGPEVTGGQGFFFAYECIFPTNQAGEYALDMANYGHYTRLVDCEFADRLRTGTECHLIDPVFHVGGAAVGVIVPAVTGVALFTCQGAKFRSSGSNWTYYFQLDEPTLTFSIIGTSAANAGATAAIKVNSAFDASGVYQTVVGNNWGCDLGLDATGIGVNMIVNYSNNTHTGTTGPGAATNSPVIARGRFANSTFNANGPAFGYIDFETGSTINTINGVQYGSGVPSHTANQSQLYFDLSTNTLYINTSTESGATWSILGVSGGGGAAPVGEAYVTIGNTANLSAERALTAGNNVTITDAGANSTVTIKAPDHIIAASFDGATASTTAPWQKFGPMPAAGSIVAGGVMATTVENITCGATSGIYDIHKILAANVNTDGQGTTIYTTQANRPTISNGNMHTTATDPDVTTFAAGDYLAFYTDQVGTNITFVVVSVKVRFTP